MASVDLYIQFITSEHVDKPKYIQTITVSIEPFADNIEQIDEIPGLFDIDVAVGSQLDVVGQWVGQSRKVAIPLEVYFSFDVEGLGFEEGFWYSEFDPLTGLVSLPDYYYRILLYATIHANMWDGTIPSAYDAYETLFEPLGNQVLIIDNPIADQFFQFDNEDLGFDAGIWFSGQTSGVMTMSLVLVGDALDAVTLSLFTGSYLDLRPEAVQIVDRIIQSIVDNPIFGFDYDNDYIQGWDDGAWGLFNGFSSNVVVINNYGAYMMLLL